MNEPQLARSKHHAYPHTDDKLVVRIAKSMRRRGYLEHHARIQCDPRHPLD